MNATLKKLLASRITHYVSIAVTGTITTLYMALRNPTEVAISAAVAAGGMWTCYGCTTNPQPNPPPQPIGTGGTKGTGGVSSIGGSHSTGGLANTGGSSTAPCPTFAAPDTPAPTSTGAKKLATQRKMPKRHHRKPGRTEPTKTVAVTCSVMDHVCDPPLNQGQRGSCTGNASDGALCSLGDSTDYNENEADTIYENGTCIDNGCTVPCTCTSCTVGYCPTTDANDNGSDGSGVSQYLLDIGKIKSYTTADTTSQLLACLSNPDSAAVIGVDWYNSQFNTNSDGRIIVNTSSGLAGGHELFVTGYDAQRGGVWVHNSWGLWGQCYKAQENANTPNDGTGCGYGWIALIDLVKLNFDGDCLHR